jgi:acyl-CoA hydrolase
MNVRPLPSAYLTEHFRAGDRVFAAGLTGESALLRDELRAFPARAAGVEFTSVQLPGIDQTDYVEIHPEASSQAFFMTPRARAGLIQRRTALHALDYTGIARHLLDAAPFDCAIGQFTPPDAQGWCGPGLSCDFTPLIWSRALRRVGHLNPELPRIDSSFKVHISDFDAVVDAAGPLLTVAESAANNMTEEIGRNAARLIRDGDTLQFGIGSALPAVARALGAHRRLRIHSGMVSQLLRTLWDSGALDRDADIVTGVVLGDSAFYDYVERLGRVFLDDVRKTHAVDILATIPRFIAINSAVEVDLFGQVNSERSDGSIQAGAGGLPAFAQGAQVAPNGRLLICLASTAQSGQISRIVPALDAKGLCTVPRYLADAVVTEHGVAELRGLPIASRAEALISVSHPDHRGRLATAWDEMAKRF